MVISHDGMAFQDDDEFLQELESLELQEFHDRCDADDDAFWDQFCDDEAAADDFDDDSWYLDNPDYPAEYNSGIDPVEYYEMPEDF